MPQVPQSKFSKYLSREYPEKSRKLNRVIRKGKGAKIILENGDEHYFSPSSLKLQEKDFVTINLNE